jgi:uncharacterized membrane protein YraQ (UPF0718 family)
MAETSGSARRFVKASSGWVLLAAVAGLYGIAALFDPVAVGDVLATFVSLVLRIVPVLVLVFGFLFLANLFLQRKWLVRHLGTASGPRGWALTVVCGILSVGPLYAWYPLLGDLKEKGVSGALIATFLYSRALKLPLLPLMVHYFGAAYTVALSVCIIAFSVLSGLLMKWFAGIDGSRSEEDKVT